MKFNKKYIAVLILATPILLSACGGSSHAGKHHNNIAPSITVTSSKSSLNPGDTDTLTYTLANPTANEQTTVTATDSNKTSLFDASNNTCSLTASTPTCTITTINATDSMQGSHTITSSSSPNAIKINDVAINVQNDPAAHIEMSSDSSGSELLIPTAAHQLLSATIGTDTPQQIKITFTAKNISADQNISITTKPSANFINMSNAGTCSLDASGSCTLTFSAKAADKDGQQESIAYTATDQSGKTYPVTPANSNFTMTSKVGPGPGPKKSYTITINDSTQPDGATAFPHVTSVCGVAQDFSFSGWGQPEDFHIPVDPSITQCPLVISEEGGYSVAPTSVQLSAPSVKVALTYKRTQPPANYKITINDGAQPGPDATTFPHVASICGTSQDFSFTGWGQSKDFHIPVDPSLKQCALVIDEKNYTVAPSEITLSTSSMPPVNLTYTKQADIVPGWPAGKISMGTIHDASAEAKAGLAKHPVSAIFTYAGEGGDGDRGKVVPLDKSKIPTYLGIANMSAYNTMPVFVIYTANASGGGTEGAETDLTATNANLHFQQLIMYAQALESSFQKRKIRSTVVLNPDFLGNIYKDGKINPSTTPLLDSGNTYASLLKSALSSQQVTGHDVPQDVAQGGHLQDYIHAINWIMGAFAPDIPYGWEDADWAGAIAGNDWIHAASHANPNSASMIKTKATGEIKFLSDCQLITPVKIDSSGKTTKPAFIAFDKYGANPIFQRTTNGPIDYSKVEQGYLFNAADWDSYINYTSQVAQQLKLPLMLFQIPGAHLPLTGDTSIANLATFPDYLFGDQDDLNTDLFSKIPGDISDKTYTTKSTTAGQYLLESGAEAWQQSRTKNLISKGVFAILWGGGGFATGVIPESGPSFDDNGWLYNKISSAGGDVALPSKKPIPSAQNTPAFQQGADYINGDFASTNGKVYRCCVATWCKAGGLYAPGATYGNLDWAGADSNYMCPSA